MGGDDSRQKICKAPAALRTLVDRQGKAAFRIHAGGGPLGMDPSEEGEARL